MSFDQLRYFVAVAEEGNIGRAARRLNICQPPLSRRIKQLELELGTALFERTARGVTLLPSGARLLPYAHRILREVRAARDALASARDLVSTPASAEPRFHSGPAKAGLGNEAPNGQTIVGDIAPTSQIF